jgi:RNA polymerase sigma factor (sigma-70 family)
MKTSSTDLDLITLCLAESDDAWTELVNRYSGRIYWIALKYGLSEHDASEVLQNVCLAWWRSLDQIRDVERLSAWLSTLAGRMSLRFISAQRRVRQHESPFGEETDEHIPSSDVPVEDTIVAAERSAILRAAVDRLDDRCRCLVRMLYFSADTPKYEEIADEFGLALGSIGAMRQRCLARLRRELDKESNQGCMF